MRDMPDNEVPFKTQDENGPEKAPVVPESVPTEPPEASGSDPLASPPFEKEPLFRIKDQFADLGSIPPSMTRENARPVNKAPLPGAGLAESARPGRTIRKENSFQDFFRNLDIIKIARGVYRRFWVVLLFAFTMLMLFIPLARALQGGVSWSAESFILYTRPTQKHADVPGSSFILRPLSQDTLFDLFFSPSYLKELEETTGIKSLQKNVSFDSKSKSDIVTLQINNMPDEQAAVDAINRLAEEILSTNDQYYRRLAAAAHDQYKIRRESEEKNFTVIP